VMGFALLLRLLLLSLSLAPSKSKLGAKFWEARSKSQSKSENYRTLGLEQTRSKI
jgi:hypothetical protein